MQSRTRNRLFAAVMTVFAMFALVLGLSTFAYASAGQVPTHSKTLKNNGDGTYTLSLDVVGDSEKKPNKVNVIVIMDVSGSMDTSTSYWWGAPSRMDAAKSAVNSLATKLYAYNTPANPDTVEMALVEFSTTASPHEPTQSLATFSNAVNNLNPDGGTNWEAALQEANNVTFSRTAPTFVIFVSDGNPTFRFTEGDYPNHRNDYDADYNRRYGVWGTGNDDYDTTVTRCYDHAVDDAQTLANKVGKDNFYTIGAYGSVTRMRNLTTAAGAPASNYYSATNTDELESALDSILAKIEMSGIADAEIVDGTTSKVATSSGVVSLINIVPNSFKYYRNGVEWTDADTPVPPAATINADGKVEWDLSSLDVLDNGVRYTVTFDVYPSQTALDYAARLENGEAYTDVVPAEARDYFDANGALATNTTATLSYDDTRTNVEEDPVDYTNPPKQPLSTSTMSVEKLWVGDTEPDNPIELDVMADDDTTPFASVSLSKAEGWKKDIYISYGLMKNEQVLTGAEGHDFSFAELPSVQYHWELDAPTVHPMIIDGTPTMLVKQDADHKAPAGATTYTINGATYYVDAAVANLTATNYRRSNLNLTKAVTGEGASETALFPFTLNVVNSKVANGSADDTSSDYYVWFSVFNGTNVKRTTNATQYVDPDTGDTYYYAPSGSDITVELQAGDNLRFTNLPSGTTYTFTEGDTDGFKFDKAENTGEVDATFNVDGKTTTGTVVEPGNKSYAVTYTNEYALVDVTATKEWNDASNQDGIRPESLELTLNGLPTGTTAPEPEITKSEDGNTWTYTWKGVPKYDSDGNAITYTVTEKNVPEGYTCEVTTVENGGKITNAHTPEETELTVTKVWDDASDQDGVRPDSVAFTVTGSDGNTYDATLEGEGDTWTATIENVAKYHDGGTEVTFTVDEDDVDNYTKSVDNDTLTITNSYVPEETELTVTKVWEDNSDQDGIRPDSVAFTVTGSDGKTYDATLSGEGDTWTAEVEVDKYTDGGTEVTFTVDEADVANYTKSIDNDALTITNSYKTKETEATVTKVWDDADNQDGKRPESITVQLSGNNKAVGDPITLNEGNGWTATVTGLPMNADGGNPITYTWSEDETSLPEGYELTSTSTEGTVTTLTNKHEPEKTSVSVAKAWSDADNQDGLRTDSVAVDLLANGEKANSTTLNSANEWKHTFEDLDVYANGEEIVYTVSENPVPEGYEATVSGDAATGYTVTNTHTPSTITISGTKTWDDANNQDGKRPENITVNLLADGTKVDSQVVSAPWTYSFADKPEFANGKKIDYTVTEEAVANYDGTVTGYDIKNTHVLETVDIDVEKVWDDADNQDGKRPESITINLLADGVVVDSATVTPAEDGSWTCSFEGMPKYAAGEEGREVVYTVTEDEVEGYEATVDGYLVTNVHEPEKTSVTVSKTWKDADNQDGKRPASITINLLGDGELVTSASVTPAEDGTWSYTFENLTKYAMGEVGREVVYTITEDEVAEYDTAIDGFAVTNTHTPEKTEVSVTKVWDDADDQDGIRPDTITVTLLANGEQAATAELSADNEWSYTFAELDKFAAGKEISYTVAETQVEGYASETTGTAAEGYTITNRHTPEVTDVPVTKVWDDADDQDGIRLANVVVKLLADGADTGKTVTLSEANGWKATFTGVDKYAAGNEIAYTVAEDAPAGYQVAVSGDAAAGYTVTNTHEPELTEVKVAKVWDDADDQDGIRPASVTVKLLADGADTGKTVTLSADNEWAGTFAGLDKYAAGELVKYTVEEDPVADYAVAIAGDAAEGFTVTNSHTPGTTAVNVKKVWDDGSNHDGIRPASVTVELLADGKATGKTVTLDESNGWTGSFADLQKNAAGKAIKYTVEEKAVEGYTAKISGSAADGFTVTNYHKVAEAIMIDPPVQKVIKVPVGTKPAAATFTFQMKAISEGAPMPEGSVNGVKTMTIEGAGSKEFGEAWIDMPGTYVYEITEVKGDAKGYAYDATAYTLTVEVTKNADGDLVKTETITDASGKKVEKVVFTNTFTPEPPVLPQTSDDSVPTSTLVVTALTGVALVAAGSALRLRRNKD